MLLRDVAVLVDRLQAEATIDDQMVTLLPGESRTFTIRSPRLLTQEQHGFLGQRTSVAPKCHRPVSG